MSVLKAFGYGDIDELYEDKDEYNVAHAESFKLDNRYYDYIIRFYMYSEGLITKFEYDDYVARSEGFIDDLVKKGKSVGNNTMDLIAKMIKRIQEMIKNLVKNTMNINKRVEAVRKDILKVSERVYDESKANQNVNYYSVEQYEKEEIGDVTIEFLKKIEVLKGNTKNDMRVDSIDNARMFLDREFKGWQKMSNQDFNEIVRSKYMVKNEMANKKTNLKPKKAKASKASSEIQNSLTHSLKICDAIVTIPIIEYLKTEEKEIDKNSREFEKLITDYNKNNIKKESMSILNQTTGGEASKLDSIFKNFKNPFSQDTNNSSAMDQAVNDATNADIKEEESKKDLVDPAKEKEDAENKMVLDKVQLYFTTRSVCTDSNIRYLNRVVATIEKFGSENIIAYTFITKGRSTIKAK